MQGVSIYFRGIDPNLYEFNQAFKAWDSIQRKYPAVLIFQKPEATATNPNIPACEEQDKLENCYYKTVYDRHHN